MISLSTQDFLSLATAHPKEAKALIKALVTPPSTEPTAQQAALQKTPQTIQTLLEALASKQSTPTQIKQTLENASWFKQAPALSNQLTTLVSSLQNIPELKSFAPALEGFLKTISSTSGSELKSQLQRSGVFFESSLKDQARPMSPSAPLPKALAQLQQQLPSLPLPKESKARIQQAIQAILSPPPKPQPTPSGQPFQHLTKTLDEALTRATTQAEKRPLFPLAQKITHLSQSLDTLRTQAAQHLIASKPNATTPPSERLVQPTLPAPIKQHIQTLLHELKTLTLPLPKTNPHQTQSLHASLHKEIGKVTELLQKVLHSPKPVTHDFAQALHVKPLLLKTPVLKPVLADPKTSTALPLQTTPRNQTAPPTLLHVTPKAPLLGEAVTLQFSTTPPVLSLPLAPASGLDVQDQLKLAITRLKSLIQALDKPAQPLPAQLEHTKTLFNQTKQLLQHTNAPQHEPTKAIAEDIKKTLLELKNSTSPTAHKEVHQLANKSLAHIEMHQLYSLASQSAHTYLPYLWHGLQNGNMMIRNKEEEMYCQIDLEFERYQKVHIMLVLSHDRYVALSIALENPTLKEKISTHIQELRLMLSAVGLVPKAITLLPYEKREVLENHSLEEDFGVNITV